MPAKEMAGRVYYATATKVTPHGAACAEDGFVGVAIKQQAPFIDAGSPARSTIAVGEDFAILLKGETEVNAYSGAAHGDLVRIDPDDNTLSNTGGGNKLVLGKLTSLAGERGTPTGKIRVNLDQKA